MTFSQEVVELRDVLNQMNTKGEMRKYLLNLRKSGYDFTSAVNYLLFGPQDVREETLGFYVLKTIANSKLLKFELAWCYINGYGCGKSVKNQSAGRSLLIKLGDNAFKNPPLTLFDSSFSGISWDDSGLEIERDKELKLREKERIENEKRIEKLRKENEIKKKRLIKVRQWRTKYKIICYVMEKIVPISYYVIITFFLDYLSLSIYESEIFFKIDALIFQILLITGFMIGCKPADKTEKIRFPFSILFLPFINCVYLFWGNSFANNIWVNIFLIITGVIIFKIGIRKQNKRKFLKDFKFFRRVIYPSIPSTSDYLHWECMGGCSNEYVGLMKNYPHLPERFKNYRLIYDWEDGILSTPGTYFNGKRIDII